MSKDPEHNPGAEPPAGGQPAPDPRAELLRQIRRALILEADLRLEDDSKTGFDPYNNRLASSSGVWRVRRRG